jgi:uncharacterized protein (DUF2344 family)
MAELFGIETLKDTAKAVVKLGLKVEDALEDGKINFIEAISIGISTAPEAFALSQKGTQLKQEYQDLSDEERVQLVEYVVEEFDLESDKLEAIIEAGFEVLVAIEKLLSKAREAKAVEE